MCRPKSSHELRKRWIHRRSTFGKVNAKKLLGYLMEVKNEITERSHRHSGYSAITLAWDCHEREMTADQKLAFIMDYAEDKAGDLVGHFFR